MRKVIDDIVRNNCLNSPMAEKDISALLCEGNLEREVRPYPDQKITFTDNLFSYRDITQFSLVVDVYESIASKDKSDKGFLYVSDREIELQAWQVYLLKALAVVHVSHSQEFAENIIMVYAHLLKQSVRKASTGDPNIKFEMTISDDARRSMIKLVEEYNKFVSKMQDG